MVGRESCFIPWYVTAYHYFYAACKGIYVVALFSPNYRRCRAQLETTLVTLKPALFAVALQFCHHVSGPG